MTAPITPIPSQHSQNLLLRWTHAIYLLFSSQGARQGYLAAIDQGAISFSNFLATVILARSVSPTDLGVYGVGFIALRLVRSLQEGLFIQPMNVLAASLEPGEFRRYATSTSLLQVGLAIGTSLVAAVGGWTLTALGNDTAGPALFSLWFAFLGWELQEYLRRMLYTRGLIISAVINTLLANAVRLAIMLVWARAGTLSGTRGMDAIAWGSLAALLPGLWATRTYWTLHPLSLKETWLKNWGFGRWILGSSLAGWIAVEFYPILTAGMISFAAAGAYRALQNLVAPIHLLLRATDTFLTPRAARAYDLNGRAALKRTLRIIYLVSGIPILGVLGIALLFPAQLLRLLYGETYVKYSNSMVLMVLFYVFLFAYYPLQTAFKAARQSRPIFIANMAAMAAMFTVGLWAIQRWDVAGTIAGQALNALIVASVLWGIWLRQSKNLTQSTHKGSS